MKMRIQDIQKTIGETPEKEENCHWWSRSVSKTETRGLSQKQSEIEYKYQVSMARWIA